MHEEKGLPASLMAPPGHYAELRVVENGLELTVDGVTEVIAWRTKVLHRPYQKYERGEHVWAYGLKCTRCSGRTDQVTRWPGLPQTQLCEPCLCDLALTELCRELEVPEP